MKKYKTKCPVCLGKRKSISFKELEDSIGLFDEDGRQKYIILPCGHGVKRKKLRKRKVKIWKLKDILKEEQGLASNSEKPEQGVDELIYRELSRLLSCATLPALYQSNEILISQQSLDTLYRQKYESEIRREVVEELNELFKKYNIETKGSHIGVSFIEVTDELKESVLSESEKGVEK